MERRTSSYRSADVRNTRTNTSHRTEPRTETRSRTRTRHRRTPLQYAIDKAMPYIIMLGLPLFGMLLGILLTSAYMNKTGSYLQRDYGRELTYASYTVRSGDTMWSIAEDMAALNPEFADVRQYLTLLQRTNKNYGDILLSGTTILIPYYEGRRGQSVLEIYEKYGLYEQAEIMAGTEGK